MTTKKPDPQHPTESNQQGSPWRDAASRARYAGAEDGGDVDRAPSFMSALRRFRARHGLSPTGQIPLVSDDDLNTLRATDCERPGLDLDDIATGPDSDDATH